MKKVLVVEDEQLIADLLQRKLRGAGYYAFVAGDGEVALQQIRDERPDIVLLDIVLPRLNGFEVLAEMQKDEELQKIPVIIISNSGQQAEIEKAKEVGVRDWLVKTEFDPKEVLEKVQKQIGPA
ncbi:MAG: response regulator [Candidatus Wildermuthbacteria bacterium]|nr:response regulator [Candidatus Wildermuthbacteria bacterium]